MSNRFYFIRNRKRLPTFSLNILPVFSLLLGLIFPVPLFQNSQPASSDTNFVQPSSVQTDQSTKSQNCQQSHHCALRFNGVNQWVELDQFRGFDTPAFTLETWFNWADGGTPIPSTNGSLTDGIPFITIGGSEQPGANSNVDLFFGIQASTGKLMVVFNAATSEPGLVGQDYSLVGSTQVTPRVWHHAAATYDGRTLRLFLDGNLDAEFTYDTPIMPQLVSSRDVYIAAALTSGGSGQGFFKGELDEVRIWEVARSKSEIQSTANSEDVTDPNLIGHWSMNEGTGAEVHDSSGKSGHGKAKNSPVWTDGPTMLLSNSPSIDAIISAASVPNLPTLISPLNGATNISMSPTLNVSVSDPDAGNLTVTFYGRAAPGTHRQDFSLVVLPDTQKYTVSPASSLNIFNAQTQWIVDQQSAQNIVFVSHLGDMGDDWNVPSEWNIVNAAMSKLETAGIPYGIGPGNCDEDHFGVPPDTTFFNTYFPVSRFAGRPYYGGAYNGDNANSYQLFSASGIDFLVINLKYNISYDTNQGQAILAWAHNVLQTNSNRRAIVINHYLLDTNNNFSSDASMIYSALKDTPNIFLMMGGHADTEGQRQDPGTDGHTIYSLRSDYQTRANGGNGWLRVLRFSPETNRINISTYSPYLNQYETDADSQFSLDYNMNGTSFQVIGTANVPSGSNATINWQNLLPGGQYDWYVGVNDGTSTTFGPVWSFTTVSGSAAPVITTQPVNQTVNAGQTTIFSSAASGSPTPTAQWQVSTNNGNSWSDISGATSTSYSFTAQAGDNGSQYHAVFTNSAGSATTNHATLTVNTVPVVTTSPTNQTVNAGQAAIFTAAASGTPAPNVQWQVSIDNGATWNNIAVATSSPYSFSTTAGDNLKQFRAVFTNSAGSAASNAAILTVYFPPSITLQPVNQTVNPGATATFTAAASGNPTATVQWQSSPDGTTWTPIGGATSPTYSFQAQSGDSGNQYRAVFTNSAGSATTNAATLMVNTVPVVTTNPTNQTVNAGQTATFTAAATGNPTPTVQWQVSTDNGSTWNNIAQATAPTYAFTAQGFDSGKQYHAVFSNAAGTATTSAATLTVNTVPVVTTNPINQTVNANQTATFTAAASGNPTPTPKWQVSTNSGSTWTDILGATSPTYSFQAQLVDNGNQYRAVFTNVVGSTTTNAAILTITTANSAPIITTQPTSQSVIAGQAATFTAAASGSPTLTVQWQVSSDGTIWTNISGATSTTYTFAASTGDNGKQFHAVFTNSAGSATTNPATLTVNTVPSVSNQPSSQAVNAGLQASFSAAASGSPTPTLQWQVSIDNGNTWTNIPEATSSPYSFLTTPGDNLKQFRAVFTNIAGSATSNAAILTVYFPPAISSQPVNQTVTAGETATFIAAASGNLTPTVWWQVSINNGSSWSDISGATSTTYSFTANSADNGKQFHAVFTNSAGTAMTTAATLTVNTVPVVTTNPTNQTVIAGQTASFTAAATGSPAPTAQWQVSTNGGLNWTDIGGANATTYSFSAAAGDNGKQYHAVFTNAAGNATTSTATLTVNTVPVVTTNPSNQTVNAGQTATFTAAATGNPTPTVQWQVSTDNGSTWNNIAQAITPTYAFTAQGFDSGKQYHAVFSNAAGTATTTNANLTVNTTPVITISPSNQTVNSGQAASFNAVASGSPNPTVQWQVSTNGGTSWSNITGATSATYSFTAQSADNGKQFRAVYTNIAGSATTAPAILTVNFAPTVTTQPANQTVNTGQTATFSAAASGNPSPTVQWQLSTDNGINWSNIAGATATTYTTPATLPTDNGKQFRAIFTNSVGSVTSTSAILTVINDLIFKDTFNTCNASAWTGGIVNSGKLIFNTASGRNSSCGMGVTFPSSSAAYVIAPPLNAEVRLNTRFYFNPNTLKLARNGQLTLFYAYNTSGQATVSVQIHNASSALQLRAGIMRDGQRWSYTSWQTISKAWHSVEFDWIAATSSSNHNGSLTFWLDGNQVGSLTAMDNDQQKINKVSLGVIDGTISTTQGSFFFDDYESRRLTYIGP